MGKPTRWCLDVSENRVYLSKMLLQTSTCWKTGGFTVNIYIYANEKIELGWVGCVEKWGIAAFCEESNVSNHAIRVFAHQKKWQNRKSFQINLHWVPITVTAVYEQKHPPRSNRSIPANGHRIREKNMNKLNKPWEWGIALLSDIQTMPLKSKSMMSEDFPLSLGFHHEASRCWSQWPVVLIIIIEQNNIWYYNYN
jgi:hypothetical protein